MPSPDNGTAPRVLRFTWPLQLLLLLVAGGFALLFHLTVPNRFPSDENYRDAAAWLERNARPGDVVLLFPWWTERARLYLGDQIPVIGHLDAESQDLTRYDRIWVLGQPSLPRVDQRTFEERFLPGRTKLAESTHFGPLELSLYRNDRARRLLFSAPDAIAEGEPAQVYVEQNGQRLDCPRRGDAFRCPGPGGIYVRREWHEVLYEPRQCLFMRPPGGDARLVVEFPNVPMGERLLLEAGVIWEHAVKKGPEITTTYVRMENATSGVQLAEVTLPPGVEGFKRAELTGDSVPNGSPGIRITAQAQRADYRDLCVDLSSFAAQEARP